MALMIEAGDVGRRKSKDCIGGTALRSGIGPRTSRSIGKGPIWIGRFRLEKILVMMAGPLSWDRMK